MSTTERTKHFVRKCLGYFPACKSEAALKWNALKSTKYLCLFSIIFFNANSRWLNLIWINNPVVQPLELEAVNICFPFSYFYEVQSILQRIADGTKHHLPSSFPSNHINIPLQASEMEPGGQDCISLGKSSTGVKKKEVRVGGFGNVAPKMSIHLHIHQQLKYATLV